MAAQATGGEGSGGSSAEPSRPPPEPARVVFERVSVRLSAGNAIAEVDLRRAGLPLQGSAVHGERSQAIVRATLDALGVPADGSVVVRGIERHEDVVLVRLSADRDKRSVQLIGSAWVPEHEDPALVRATLDATNRYLSARMHDDALYHVPDPRAITAHQIRTPLTIVSQTLETLLAHEERLGPEARRDLLERAIAQTGNLLDRVDTLLAQRSGRTRATEVDLVAELEAAIHEADRTGAVRLEAPAGVRVWARPGHVREIAGILVGNALQHGAPPVTVQVVPGVAEIDVVVEDAGPGVAGHVLATLFTTSTGTTSPQGHGIGLAAARVLAQASGGMLSYEPRDPSGARFLLRLPRSSVAEA